MKTYSISSNKLSKEYIKNFESATDARNWVINTLDLSQNWTITETLPFKPQ